MLCKSHIFSRLFHRFRSSFKRQMCPQQNFPIPANIANDYNHKLASGRPFIIRLVQWRTFSAILQMIIINWRTTPFCPAAPIFLDEHSSSIASSPNISAPLFTFHRPIFWHHFSLFHFSQTNILAPLFIRWIEDFKPKYDFLYCPFLSGPALSGSLVKTFGFGAMLTGCGIVCFLYCPLLLLLRLKFFYF